MSTNFTVQSGLNQQVSPLDALVLESLMDFQIFASGNFPGVDGLVTSQQAAKGKPKTHDVTPATAGKSKGQTIRVPQTGLVEVYDKLANIELADQAFDVNSIPITLNSHKAGSVLIEDAAMAFDNIGTMEKAAKELAKAAAQSYDDQVISIFPSFTTDIGNNSATTLTDDDIGKACETLMKKGIDPMKTPTYLLCSVYYFRKLSQSRNISTASWDLASKQYQSFNLIEDPSGVKIIPCNRLPVIGGNVVNMMLSENAIMTGWGIAPKTERSRDYKALGDRVSIQYLAGFAKLRDAAGVKILRANQ